MFDKVTTRALEELSRGLAVIGEEEPKTPFEQYRLFAKSLSVLMRCEIARRTNEQPEER